MWLVYKLLYFALINLQSCNRTVGCNITVTWANHPKSSPLNPPIPTLITITIVTNSRDWLCKIVPGGLVSSDCFEFWIMILKRLSYVKALLQMKLLLLGEIVIVMINWPIQSVILVVPNKPGSRFAVVRVIWHFHITSYLTELCQSTWLFTEENTL